MNFETPNYSNLNFDEMAAAIGLKPKHIPVLVMSFIDESKNILQDLQVAIDTKNYNDIQHHAHSIKGSSGNLKFDVMYNIAKAMEFAAKDQDDSFAYDDAFQAISGGLSSISL